MALSLSITSGFITNSSSVIYNFPKELLDVPEVQALFRYYGVDMENGVMPRDPWIRGEAGDGIAFTTKQKKKINRISQPVPSLSEDEDDTFSMMACDESGTYVYGLIQRITRIASAKGLASKVSRDGFN